MAEFKLGRIRFIWKGDWSSQNVYYKDDIVRHGGNTYVCVNGHTSTGSFATDFESYWNKIAEGQEWKGDWTTDTLFKVNDIVKYGGYLYVANTEHTSANDVDLGLEDDQEFWDLYAEGFDYTGNWTSEKRYKVNDLVIYGATVYLCTQEHTSAATEEEGLEEDSDKWDIFSKGFDWQGDWETDYRYKLNDIIRYGGQIYVCNEGHTSAETVDLGLEQDQTKWDYFHKGFEFKGNWIPGARYKVNDLVKYGSGVWICVNPHTSQEYFTQDESKWNQFVEGLEFEDTWSPTKRYQPGDLATYGGFVYVAKTNNLDSKPTENESDWDVFITGFRFKGVYGEDSSGQDYQVGDVVRLGGYTYLCIQDHEDIQRPPNTEYWEQLNPGIEWKDDWTDETFYDVGDAVRLGVNSYICVQSHTSDDGDILEENRPDQDDGTYWNLLAGGSENAVLEQDGDLVYYGGAGPTRLPIGSAGQVLKVNDTANEPEWGYIGRIDNIFYVDSTIGKDIPAPIYGVTTDQPWQSINFAAREIDKGALRPNARQLIERNKAFIINETLEWVNDQIAEGSGIWTGFTNDDEYLTLVEFNKVVDSLLYDLTHNGNEETRSLALSYFDSGSLVSDLQDEDEQFVAAINHMETVIDSVLSNLEITGPDKYSAFDQDFDNSFTEEPDAQDIVGGLLDIITDSITAATDSSIPRERIPNNTISVKTGTLQEVLPISVPKLTAVAGDELRSTRIEAAGSLVSSADVPYAIEGIENLGTNINSLLSGDNDGDPAADGLSSFSQESPDTSLSISDSTVAADASGLAQEIIDYIDWAINGATGDSTQPTITGTNTAKTDILYTYASEIIEKNREYLKAEVVAYIENEYPNYDFDEDRYLRDIDRYIDAIRYDLIYTGNYKSLTAAKYYVNAVSGSTSENMFFVRNGTGVRNCTVAGLSGTLQNVAGSPTKRPDAGAYVSLDPGWGPADNRVWINTRSPYIQNVSTFGTACVGCKIDGDLHDGGNDSIVANDFTQILSDGIGVWCTNLGRTELVSVFSYYGYIGYLAENGGKIRATNGNSSYGTFGTVAEGIDNTEVPVTGTVNNRDFEAIIDRVVTDGDKILTFEYTNAGENYSDTITAIQSVSVATNVIDSNRTDGFYTGVTGSSTTGSGQEFTVSVTDGIVAIERIDNGGTGFSVSDIISVDASEIGGTGSGFDIEIDEVGPATVFTVTGDGFNAEIDSVQVVDGGVFEVRMLDTDQDGDGEGDFGGDGYFSSENVAQEGDTTSITLSNTEVALSSQLIGMAIFIISGRGAGQYGFIDSYNDGTKIAQIKKHSDETAGWDALPGANAIETTLDSTTQYRIEPRISFTPPSGGTYAEAAKARPILEDERIVRINIWDPGVGYASAPSITITDPNNTIEAPTEVRIGDGVLTQPTWVDRGQAFETASAEVTGQGFADRYQPGEFLRVQGLSDVPLAGSNLEFASLPGQIFKLVVVRQLVGSGPQGESAPFTAQLQVSPDITIDEAPEHDTAFELRIRYSQVRLTGHDFLDIGTGNFEETNYPNEPEYEPDPEDETVESGGGRVFYTSTDQDGNFRVGDLFSVEQSTGVATLNADAFNISGLSELSLGELGLGDTGVTITEFSADGTFSANSDNIVPTQAAIKTYITSQIGGGSATLNVNSITAGEVQILSNQITTTSGNEILVLEKMDFQEGIDGVPVALNYFLSQ